MGRKERRKRNLSDDNASYGNASHGNASYGNVSVMEQSDQDVAQNVAEIVRSFSLEKLDEQQPVGVNVGGHALEGENLVSQGTRKIGR